MARRRFFEDEVTSYPEYLKNIQNMMGNRVYFASKSTIEKGIESLTMIEDIERQNKLISSSILVDKLYNIGGAYNGNCARKFPIIMTIANMLSNHYNDISTLSDKELSCLGGFLYVFEPESVKDYVKIFSDKGILKETLKKTNNVHEQFDILCVIQDKYFEFAIDYEDKEGISKFKKESAMFIKNTDKEELLNMVKPLSVIVKELNEKGIHI